MTLKRYHNTAEILFQRGFIPIPEKPNSREGAIKEWPNVPISENKVKIYAQRLGRNAGVAIRCQDQIIAIDVDVNHNEASRLIKEYIRSEYSTDGAVIPYRVGKAPKFLIIFKCSDQVKRHTDKYIDQNGEVNHIEVLADRNKFTVFGRHEVTEREYTWHHGIPVDEAFYLPEIDSDGIDSIFDYFVDIADEFAWALDKETRNGNKPADNDLMYLAGSGSDRPSIEQLKTTLSILDTLAFDNDYIGWIKCGMAIHWSTKGSYEGYLIFDEWSSLGAKYKGKSDTLKRWESFSIDDSGGSKQVTYATLTDLIDTKKSVTSCHKLSQTGIKCPENAKVSQSVTNREDDKKVVTDTLKCQVLDYINESADHLKLSTLYSYFQSHSSDNLRKIVNRLYRSNKILKVDGKRGMYKRIDPDEKRINFDDGDIMPLAISLPLGMSKLVNILPSNVIIVSGETNAGKTCWGFQFLESISKYFVTHPLRNNIFIPSLRSYCEGVTNKKEGHMFDKVKFLNSEMSPQEIISHLIPLGKAGQILKEKVVWVNVFDDFEERIEPNCIIVIDYFSVPGDFWTSKPRIDAMAKKIGSGILVIMMQKKTGEVNPRGGEFSIERSRLAINLSLATAGYGTCSIRKAKLPVDYRIKPAGLEVDFKIGSDLKLVNYGEFCQPLGKKARAERNEKYKKKANKFRGSVEMDDLAIYEGGLQNDNSEI